MAKDTPRRVQTTGCRHVRTTPRCRQLYLAANFALLSLTSFLLPVCEGYKPLITPKVPELLINEGDPLEITCTSTGKINIIYPEDDKDHEIVTSEHKLIPESIPSGGEKVIFRRANTSSGDTGWYGCVDEKAGDVKPNYDDPNSSWTYVYVKSTTRPIVESGTLLIFPEVSEDVILPCRPTAPEQHVNLTLDGRPLKLNERLTFDPKVGFIIKNGLVAHSGVYECAVNQNGTEVGPQYPVKFLSRVNMDNPVISKEGLDRVTNGSSLHIKCTAEVGIDNIFWFKWTYPRKLRTNRELPPVQKPLTYNSRLVTAELVVDRVTDDDEGEYACILNTLTGRKSTSVYVHVHDAEHDSPSQGS